MSEQMNAWDRDRSYVPLRLGSNFEVPEIWPNAIPDQFSFATGKSKKLYERAVAKAFLAARPRGRWTKTGRGKIALHHFARLRRRV